ncbi:helix-turn-helix domain-containing protein [Streptomyces virginiae]
MDGAEESSAAVYAAALRKSLAGFTAAGGTQKEIAGALNVSAAALSRYLSGERVAPRDFLRALRAFLVERDQPWPGELYEELDELCGRAHAASGSPAVQLAQLREELGRLRHQQERAQQVGEARLTELEQQAGQLAVQLEEALGRARTAEGARELMQSRVQEQDEKLRHAQDYICQIEAELSQQREQAHLLQQEVAVLREQNRQLIDEQRAVPGVSTQDTSFDATLAAHRVRAAQQQETLGQSTTPPRPQSQHPRPSAFKPPVTPKDKYTPVRDSLTVLALELVICVLAVSFGAGARTTPGGFSIVKLIAAAIIFLLIGTLCWGKAFIIGTKYLTNGWGARWPSTLTLYVGPTLLVAGITTPFVFGTDEFWHWLADTAQLV